LKPLQRILMPINLVIGKRRELVTDIPAHFVGRKFLDHTT